MGGDDALPSVGSRRRRGTRIQRGHFKGLFSNGALLLSAFQTCPSCAQAAALNTLHAYQRTCVFAASLTPAQLALFRAARAASNSNAIPTDIPRPPRLVIAIERKSVAGGCFASSAR